MLRLLVKSMVLLLMLVYSLALLGGLGASQIDLVQVLIVFADVEVVGQVDVVVIDVGVSLALLGGLGASQIDLVQVAKKGFPVHHSAIILTPRGFNAISFYLIKKFEHQSGQIQSLYARSKSAYKISLNWNWKNCRNGILPLLCPGK